MIKMNQLIPIFILIPIIGYSLSLITNRKKEGLISAIAIATAAMQFIFISSAAVYFLLYKQDYLSLKLITLLKTPEFDFYIAFILDKLSFVFLFVGSILTFLVSIYSKFYIHREEGFKRFFNNIQLFFLGFNLVVIGGNFETLFLGWELIGITSFLLISFYKNRYLPIKNAMKVVSLYRLGDVFLIVAMWLCHHLWHENISFEQLTKNAWLLKSYDEHFTLLFLISLSIFIGAAIKSAMYPFSSWVARAMEGPSSSSAIFYGSLSIHLGVFLLMRTYPIWESLIAIKVIILFFGLLTSFICNSIAQSQPTVKTQIAYSSISQIGLIFIEVAFGWHNLALVHFMGNAFFRTYQILVSPSVLHYQIHNQLFTKPKQVITNSGQLLNSLYMLSIKEYNMDHMLFHYFWMPFKKISKLFTIFNNKFFYIFIIIFFNTGIILDINTLALHPTLLEFFVYSFAILALVLILISFTERLSSIYAWLNVVFGHLFIMMSISLNSHIQLKFVLMYLSSILLFGLLGYIAIKKLKNATTSINLDQYHGSGSEHPRLSILFLISCLGLIGFPISPLYIGIDLMLTYIESHEYIIMGIVGLSLIFIEISLLRVYSRLFCGIPPISNQPVAFKSS